MRTIAKKLFCLGFIELLLSLMVCSDAHATVYDADRFVKCPKCGHILREISWSSGNTFNSTLWSDGKLDAPMLPSVPSFVQCPACGEFFYPKDNHCELSRQQADKVEKEYTKALNFSQWVRAFPLIGDKKIAYWGIWHTYNDFLRSGDRLRTIGYAMYLFFMRRNLSTNLIRRGTKTVFSKPNCAAKSAGSTGVSNCSTVSSFPII